MSSSAYNPLGRFTGLAELYARCRPSYPREAVEFLLSRCSLKAGAVLVDVGCGTGISSRLFAAEGLQVIGIEPNDDMRRQAEAVDWQSDGPAPQYRPGSAEQTALPDAVADIVLCAQSFHWFEAERALQEFHRLLRPGGWVALMWNERDETDPFTAAFGEVIRSGPGASILEKDRIGSGRVLLTHPLYVEAALTVFSHAQPMEEESMIGRAYSASYAPREPELMKVFTARLREAFQKFHQNGQVVLKYQTSVYLARRAVNFSNSDPS